MDRSANHFQRELGLGPKLDMLRDPCLSPPPGVLGPALRQVELKVDGQVSCLCRQRQAHADLAVGGLARRSRVLALDADRMLSLLDEPRVVDDPGLDALVLGHCLEAVVRGRTADLHIAPLGVGDEVLEPLMGSISLDGVAAGSRGDGLHTLPLALAEQTDRVGRKRRPPALVVKDFTELVHETDQPALGFNVHADVVHGHLRSWSDPRSNFSTQ